MQRIAVGLIPQLASSPPSRGGATAAAAAAARELPPDQAATGFHVIYLPYRDDFREEYLGLPALDRAGQQQQQQQL